jgi:predicted nucleic acid-binding Zn ribbon protein
MCVVLFLFCGGEAPRVLCGEEGKPLDARRCSERCTNRNRHRPQKHRLGLFMVSRCMSLSIDSINYFEWMCVKCFGYAHW